MGELENLVEKLRAPGSRLTTRMDVVQKLKDLGTPEAVQALTEALNDKDRTIREKAVKALGEVGCPEAAPVLIGVLEGEEETLQRAAAEMLGKTASTEARDALEKACESSSWLVRHAAQRALEKVEAELAKHPAAPASKRPAKAKKSSAAPKPGREAVRRPDDCLSSETADYLPVVKKAVEGTNYRLTRGRAGERLRVVVPLPGRRKQTVYVGVAGEDSEGSPLLCVYTICGPADPKHYEWALWSNVQRTFGAMAIVEHGGQKLFVLRDTFLAEALKPVELRKCIANLAKHGDRLEKTLTGMDVL